MTIPRAHDKSEPPDLDDRKEITESLPKHPLLILVALPRYRTLPVPASRRSTAAPALGLDPRRWLLQHQQLLAVKQSSEARLILRKTVIPGQTIPPRNAERAPPTILSRSSIEIVSMPNSNPFSASYQNNFARRTTEMAILTTRRGMTRTAV